MANSSSTSLEVAQFGFVPVGEEERFRNLTSEDAFNGALTVMYSNEPEIRVENPLGAFVWHEEKFYDAISALTVVSAGIYRATTIIVPAGETNMREMLTETHEYRPIDRFKVHPENINPATNSDLRPFTVYGRALVEAA